MSSPGLPPPHRNSIGHSSVASSSYSNSTSDPFGDRHATSGQASGDIREPAPILAPSDSTEDAITPAPQPNWPIPPVSHEQDSDQELGTEPEKLSTAFGLDSSEKVEQPGDDAPPQTINEKTAQPTIERKKTGLWRRFADEYRKNYCPREEPELVIPSCPNDKEKYCYVRMNRAPLMLCGIFSLLSLAAGAWLFVKAAPYFAWYALYACISEIYLFGSFFVTILGKRFNKTAHNKIVEENPITPETAPSVDIFLPVCKEPIEILENTWKHIAGVTYPDGKKHVFILDDGGQAEVEILAHRFNFQYICRPNRPELKKAGNLRYAFTQTSSTFFAIFDADFCPRPDFLLELIPRHLADDKIAVLQTPQFFRSSGNQSWVEQGAGSVQEYFYRLVQPCRDTWGGAICVGSNAIYRREALEAVGGTAPADCSEDVHTGFYAVTRGWRVKYLPLVLACGVCPDMPRAFFSQQMRWCTGSMSLLTHRDFWKSSLSKKQKACYMTGFLYYSTTAIAAFLNPIPAPLLLWTRPDLFKYYNLFFAFPSVILGVIALRLWARSRYTLSVQYIQVIMSYAYLHAIWDRFFGTKMSWLPTGDAKAHKNHRYRNMRILCWAWTIFHNTALISGSVYRISRGLAWWNVIPALALDVFNMLCVHRFLLYRHPKV